MDADRRGDRNQGRLGDYPQIAGRAPDLKTIPNRVSS